MPRPVGIILLAGVVGWFTVCAAGTALVLAAAGRTAGRPLALVLLATAMVVACGVAAGRALLRRRHAAGDALIQWGLAVGFFVFALADGVRAAAVVGEAVAALGIGLALWLAFVTLAARYVRRQAVAPEA